MLASQLLLSGREVSRSLKLMSHRSLRSILAAVLANGKRAHSTLRMNLNDNFSNKAFQHTNCSFSLYITSCKNVTYTNFEFLCVRQHLVFVHFLYSTADIKANGLWEPRFNRTFFDLKIPDIFLNGTDIKNLRNG